jgi:hypothetical protein
MVAAWRLTAIAAALLLVGAAGQAHAQSLSGLRVKPAEARSDDPRWGPQAPSKVIQLENRRWGVKLNLDQPVGRNVKDKDYEAGAYYRVTPSLRVGGAVRLDEKAEGAIRPTPRDQQPRVRLETAFQF